MPKTYRLVDDPEFSNVMKKIIKVMAPWSWCMIGGRSVEMWSNPPQTPDIDILAKVEFKDIRRLTERMRSEGIFYDRAFDDPDMIPIIFFKSHKYGMEVDVVGAWEQIHFDAIGNAPTVKFKSLKFPVASPEFVVMLKSQVAVDIGRGKVRRERDALAIKAIAKSNKLNKKLIESELSEHSWVDEARFLRSIKVI